MKDIVVIGLGGASKEVSLMVKQLVESDDSRRFAGFVVNDEEGPDIFGDDDKLLSVDYPIDVVISIGNTYLRKKLYEKYSANKNISFPNIIDKDAIIKGKVEMGIGNIICAGTILTTDIQLGNFDFINMACTVAHDNKMADFVTVNPGCNLSGNVTIGALTEVGTGSQIVQGKTIGEEVDIWAGSTIIKNVKDKAIVVGTPAKAIRYKE